MEPDCYSCAQLAATGLAARDRLFSHGGLYVAHAFDTSLPGWLVVVAERHMTSLAELDADEAAALGRLLAACSRALEAELGCEKCYAIFLAEAPGFSHLHVHVVPRAPDMPEDRRGAAVFAYLRDPEASRVSPERRDEIAAAVGARLAVELGEGS